MSLQLTDLDLDRIALNPRPEGFGPGDRIAELEAEVARLAALLQRVAAAAAETAQRQAEMQTKLLKAGAFEKKSSIIMPGMN